jgi:methylmalonyl-CoA mutase cobalamin-binding subunit
MTEIQLDALLPEGLPSGADVVAAGRERARALEVGRSQYVENRVGGSDRALKERYREDGTISTYINLGYKTWAETADGLRELLDAGQRHGFRLDRVSLIPDRRMGLPDDLRARAHEETGIGGEGGEDDHAPPRDVDVQPVWNDHNIWSPNAVANTAELIQAGFGYIGSLAQQNYGYPLWDDDVEQVRRGVEALGMLAEKRDDGLVVEAYIEDGYCASFHDLATSLGWCMFHRYVCEELIGAPHSQSYGSTFTNPVRKQAFGLALDTINVHRVPPSFTHGDTNSFQIDDHFDRNAATVMADVFYTAMRERAFPSGGALHATPVSEAVRIPTVDELVQSLLIVDEASRRASEYLPLMDWRPVLELRDRIVDGGQRFFERLLGGLSELGVNTRDPLQLILATRRIGGTKLEELFGAGEPDSGYPRGFAPVVPSDTLIRLLARRDAVLDGLTSRGRPDLRGLTIAAASGDVHEYGLFVVSSVLEKLGAVVIDLGTSVTASTLAKAAAEADADAVCMSTYNGMALSLGRELRDEVRHRGLRAQVFLGGRLNQDLDGESAADVRSQLAESGVVPCDTVDDLVRRLAPNMVAT